MRPNKLELSNWRGDLRGGLGAATVALPLALAFGYTSGAGAMAGLYCAIFVGVAAAVFGGTPTQIAGPTGLLTILAAQIFAEYTDMPMAAFTVIMLGGVFQMLFGYLKLGKYINLLPYPVISGLTTGIGCILIIMQLDPLTGHPPQQDTVNALTALPEYLQDPNFQAIGLGVVAFAIAKFTPVSVARIVPSALLALVVGMLLGYFVFTGAPVIGEITQILPNIHTPVINRPLIQDMFVSGLVVALIGSIESLLASMAADNATRAFHDPEKELVGQGLGNVFAGLFGALPGAGATFRTMANIRAGGRTQLSGIVHSLTLLVIALALTPLIARIPNAVLAGILIKVGVDVIDWSYLRRIRRAPKTGVIFMLLVLVLTVFVSVITAVVVGMVLASLLFVKRMADLQLESVRTVRGEGEAEFLSEPEAAAFGRCQGRALILRLAGPMTFGAANSLMRRLGPEPDYDVLIIDLLDVPAVDSSATLAFEHIIRRAQRQEHPVILVGLNMRVARMFSRLSVLDLIREMDRTPTRLEAFERAAEIIAERQDAAQ